jgi:hypothetical protein
MAIMSLSTHPGAIPSGFVTAMRAEILTSSGPPQREWIIVARWGLRGEYLSVSRTERLAAPARVAPIDLTPRRTSLARMIWPPLVRDHSTFLFMERRPPLINVAGAFMSARGYVQLRRKGSALGLYAEGRFITHGIRATWRLQAVRGPWVGEFVDVRTIL